MTALSNGVTNGFHEGSSEDKKFVIDSRFECPICLSCLKEPFLTACGHRFCGECIHQWLKKEGSCCPIDGKAVSVEHDLFPDNYTKREIAQEIVECPYPGCSKQLPLLETEAHIVESHEKGEFSGDLLQCPFKNIGCHFVFKSTTKMLAHSQSYLNHHLHLLTNAHKELSFKFQERHVSSKAAEAEMWTPNKSGSPVSTENSHQDITQFQTLLENLYERIVLLEQSNREQQIQVKNLKDKVEILTLENTRLKIELPLRICSGTLVWNVKNITQKLSAMTKDPSTRYYSDGFYTSYSGYRFCARMNTSPNDLSYLSVLIHMMRGENDHSVSWPFSGRMAVTLIHPTVQEKSIREVMCSRPELEAFRRPTRQMSMRAFGYTEFVPIEELVTQGFINTDDSINVKIEISCV